MSSLGSPRSVARPVSSSLTARRRRALIQRVLPLFVLAVGIVGTPTLLFSSGGLSRLTLLNAERETVQLEISRLTKRIEHLRARAKQLKQDPKAVERSARDELGLLRRTEIVFHFEPRAD